MEDDELPKGGWRWHGLGGGAATLFIAVAAGQWYLQPQLPPPAESALAHFNWKHSDVKLTAEQISEYDTNGFVVLRKVLDPAALDVVREESARLCSTSLGLQGACQQVQQRWQSDIIRDYLFNSNVAAIAHQIIRGTGVRILQDGLFAFRRMASPFFFSFYPHVDHGGNPGVYGGLHYNTKGATVWIPLQDTNNYTDGSITMFRGFPTGPCLTIFGVRPTRKLRTTDPIPSAPNMTDMFYSCGPENMTASAVVIAAEKGDMLIFNPNMLQVNQKVHRAGFDNHALYARLVDLDTFSCYSRKCGINYRPCCSKEPSWRMNFVGGSCQPQVYPKLIPEEVADHFGDGKTPHPLLLTQDTSRNALLAYSGVGDEDEEHEMIASCLEPTYVEEVQEFMATAEDVTAGEKALFEAKKTPLERLKRMSKKGLEEFSNELRTYMKLIP